LLVRREQQVVENRAGRQRRWTEAWAPTDIAPASPREMVDWLRARQTVIERADTVARRRRNVKAEQRTHDGQIETLSAQLSALGQETAGLSTLSSVLAMAQARVAQAQGAREEHEQLVRDLRRAKATADDQRDNAAKLRDALAGWNQEWALIVAANSWPAEIGADSARPVLATVSELTAQLQEIEQLSARVNGIQERLDEFDHDAVALTKAIAPSLERWSTQDAVAELQHRLDQALRIRSSRDTLAGELDTARVDLETAKQSMQRAERELKTLIALADVSTIDELPEAERRSRRRGISTPGFRSSSAISPTSARLP
jgi:chromosome segregation ATPase